MRSAEAAVPVAAASSRRDRRKSAARDHRDGGYTLIELLLVCAILAALATMSWPAMRGMLSKGRLKQAADDLEATLHKTRIRAIQSGTLLILRYAPGGRTYRVESWDAIAPEETRQALDNERAAGSTLIEESPRRVPSIENELPEGVRFAIADPRESWRRQAWPAPAAAPAEAVAVATAAESTARGSMSSEPEGAMSPDPELSESMAFYPNGRSVNAAIRLVNERRFFIDVTLRGLTGQVRTTAPARLTQDESLTAADDPLAVTSENEGTAR